MKLNWKWFLGIVLILVLIALPLVWRTFMPIGGYGMMRGYSYGMPMMGSYYGMMNPFGMWFLWLIPLGTFILLGFALGWMANQFTRRQN